MLQWLVVGTDVAPGVPRKHATELERCRLGTYNSTHWNARYRTLQQFHSEGIERDAEGSATNQQLESDRSRPAFFRRHGVQYSVLPTSLQVARKQAERARKNLLQIIDSEDSHFLGAMIIYQRPQVITSDPTVYDVIDGQQRITTIFLYLCAIVGTLCKNQLYDDAVGAFQKYLMVNRETKLASNSRVHSGKEDRLPLNRVFQDVLKDRTLADRLAPFKYKDLPAVGMATSSSGKTTDLP